MTAKHTTMGGNVNLYKRPNSDYWPQFEREYVIITQGHRSEKYVEGMMRRIRIYLTPFFGDKGLSEITPGLVQEYRIHRQTHSVARTNRQKDEEYKPPARSTLHQEIVALRQVLKTAVRHEWLSHVPDVSMPYKTAGKITRRAWFSPEEYKRLYTATRNNIETAYNKRHKKNAVQLHDLVLFMANTGLRPDEILRLEYRDITIVDDLDSDETILEIEVRGKRGLGYCKSTANAVHTFERLVERHKPQPTNKIFPSLHRALFNRILEYMSSAHGGRGYIPNRQELPHVSRDDRKILCGPYQEHDQCR